MEAYDTVWNPVINENSKAYMRMCRAKYRPR